MGSCLGGGLEPGKMFGVSHPCTRGSPSTDTAGSGRRAEPPRVCLFLDGTYYTSLCLRTAALIALRDSWEAPKWPPEDTPALTAAACKRHLIWERIPFTEAVTE